MKRFLLSLFLLIAAFATFCACFAQDNLDLRDYEGIEIPTGSFIPVISEQEISTAYCEEGTQVKFISTNDLYLYETNILPKDTEFLGYIEKINEPVVGTNASMKIKIIKLKLPDGFEMPMNAYIFTTNGNLIGGELTRPASYDKMPHYQKGFAYGTLQYVPGPARAMGEHTVVTSGADLMIILARPIWVTHTLTN